MLKLNNKGLSEVVSIVFFIFLSIISVMLLYSSVISLAKSSTAGFSPAISCAQKSQFPPSIESLGYNEQTGDLEITVRNSVLKDIGDFSFLFDVQSETGLRSDRFDCGFVCGGECVSPLPGELKTFYFTYPQGELPSKIEIYSGECSLVSRNINL